MSRTAAGRFDGQVAIITGAARGMGRTSALAFAAEGATVGLTDVRAELLAGVADEVHAAGGRAVAVAGDITDPTTIDRLVNEAKALGPVSILHNNAGFFHAAPLADHTVEDFQALLTVNCVSQFIAAKRVLPEMRAIGRGSIVNVASVMANAGLPNFAGYCASKGAVLAMTRALAYELGPDNIRVNAICPGAVETPMIDDSVKGLSPEEAKTQLDGFVGRQILKRLAAPEEIINLVLFLASDEASFMTGQLVTIDGGWTAA